MSHEKRDNDFQAENELNDTEKLYFLDSIKAYSTGNSEEKIVAGIEMKNPDVKASKNIVLHLHASKETRTIAEKEEQ